MTLNSNLTPDELDKELSRFCENNGIDFTTMHCEAFCYKPPGSIYDDPWIYLWYDYSNGNGLQELIDRIKTDCDL